MWTQFFDQHSCFHLAGGWFHSSFVDPGDLKWLLNGHILVWWTWYCQGRGLLWLVGISDLRYRDNQMLLSWWIQRWFWRYQRYHIRWNWLICLQSVVWWLYLVEITWLCCLVRSHSLTSFFVSLSRNLYSLKAITRSQVDSPQPFLKCGSFSILTLLWSY